MPPTSVASGATLQLGTSGGTVAPGAVANASVASGGIMSILAGATGAVTTATIASGGVLSVAAGVTPVECSQVLRSVWGGFCKWVMAQHLDNHLLLYLKFQLEYLRNSIKSISS